MRSGPHKLPHQVFLMRTGTASAISVEARLGQATFLVLRLVDLLGPLHREPVSPEAFQYQWAASERFVRELEQQGFEAPYLVGLIEELPEAFRTKEPWRLWTSIYGLSINLQDRERWEEVSDVLEGAWLLVDDRWPKAEALSVALRLGEHYARNGRAADAARLYRAAGRGMPPAGKRALRLAQAALLLGTDARRAEHRYRRLLREASRALDSGAEGDAELGLARALLALGLPAEAALHGWRAHKLAAHPVDQGDGLLAVAAAFEALGAFRSAAQAYWGPSLGHPRPTVRWSALAGLVRVLAHMGDRMSFERWRRFGERLGGDMPSPSCEMEFVIEAARGLARFGFREAARRFLSSAAARLHDLGCVTAAPRLLRAEEELENTAPEPAVAEAKDLPAAVRALAESVAEFGDPPPPPDPA